ncbi:MULTISPECIES: inorganic phosphate transporter [unclassified Actinomyces]|uniref:inorganic phosphate transporter n=1 Tax=unclassified Actinomyces TaxID=2609248 RepID=UPI000D59F5A7|nr:MULTISPECIES: inorganic phosphate transporter [unclassified Actinomyces]RAX23001.1 inorganic phosphate transporter [Actinomyces sp. Z5]RAX23043.1 inorganic phosphate transporter [Actinomyces sp. Z3]
MSTTLFIVVVVVVTALVFDFTNGFHDSSNAMATSVATGAFTPRRAVLIAAVLNVVGATLSTEVARTISHGMFDDALIQAAPEMVFAGLAGAILWNLATWLLGLPSSSSHALFGGLIGAVVVAAGFQGVHWGTVISKIMLPALIAPAVAAAASAVATWVSYRITGPTDKFGDKMFRYGQRISASMVALAHGTSDGQKTMGVITLVLIAAGYQEAGSAPYSWVVLAAGAAIGLGTYSGGWRIMRTMGKGLVHIDPPQGFAAETTSTVAILASSHLGFALSTTHICTGSILGTGIGRGAKVSWGTFGKMGAAWLITLPCAAVVGAVTSFIAVKGGVIGTIGVIVLLLLSALLIIRQANHNKVDFSNVNDADKVVVAKRTDPELGRPPRSLEQVKAELVGTSPSDRGTGALV